MIEFRTYTPSDLDECLKVFRSNIPTYFSEKEVPGFIESLNDPLLDGKTIGFGGIWVNEERRVARLCFGTIHRDYQKRGYGQVLWERRYKRIQSYGFVDKIEHETGDGTYKFFERFGFVTKRIDKDPIQIGIDFYQMELDVRLQQDASHNSGGSPAFT